MCLRYKFLVAIIINLLYTIILLNEWKWGLSLTIYDNIKWPILITNLIHAREDCDSCNQIILPLEIKYSLFYPTVLDSRFFIIPLLTCSLYVQWYWFTFSFSVDFLCIHFLLLKEEDERSCFIPLSTFNIQLIFQMVIQDDK